MSQIAQVQITFVPREDRLLMRFSTSQDAEFRFWLTRRYVKVLRPHLDKTLTERPEIKTQVNPVAKQELLKFEQQRAVQSSDFKTPYKSAAKTLPLGEKPVLLTRFQLKPQENGNIALSIGPEQGQGIDLALTPDLVHSIAVLLDQAVSGAEWELEQVTETASLDNAATTPDALN